MQRTRFKTKKQKQEILAPKYLKLADKMAWKYSNSTKIPFEELQSVARFALCQSIDIWTLEKAQLSTLAYHSIRNELIHYTAKNFAHSPVEHNDNIKGGVCQVRRFEFRNSVKNLSKEARDVVRIILNGPAEILGLDESASPCQLKKAIRKQFQAKGFESGVVSGIFAEISNIFTS